MHKNHIRRDINEILNRLDRKTRSARSRAIAARLFSLPEWRDCRSLLAFAGRNDEVDTRQIMAEALAVGRLVYAPRVEGADLIFHRIAVLDDISVPHPYGMLEPPALLPRFSEEARPPGRCLILVPGLAFDRHKNRLGRGKGFYDRFLRAQGERAGGNTVFALGLCFQVQLFDAVPHSEEDMAVDAVLTDTELVR